MATPARSFSAGAATALPYGIEGVLGAVYLVIGQPERLVEWCRAQLARRRDTHVHIRACLVFALMHRRFR